MRPPAIHHRFTTDDGAEVTIRPITPEDREIEQAFVSGLSANSSYLRFFSPIPSLSPKMLDKFTNVDYPREYALIATVQHDGNEVEIGVARYAPGNTDNSAEFAIVVGDDWQGHGIGRALLGHLIDEAERSQFAALEGLVLSANRNMLVFCRELGFTERRCDDDAGLVMVRKEL